MATVGNTVTPYELDAIELMDGVPYGDLITPFDTPVPYGLGNPIAQRFPVPGSALGFLIDPLLELGTIVVIDGLDPPYLLQGAINPGGNYLEPNVGQIWPR